MSKGSKPYTCIICGKPLSEEEAHPIIPGCEYWNPGGYCELFWNCMFEDCKICKDCLEKNGPVVFVEDACLDLEWDWENDEEDWWDDEEEWWDDYWYEDEEDEL